MTAILQTLCLVALLAQPGHASTHHVALGPGLDVWSAHHTGHTTATVRLELDLGLRDEREAGWGAATLLEAALIAAPSLNSETSGPLTQHATSAGISMESEARYDVVSLRLEGRAQELNRMLWIVGERLMPFAYTEAAVPAVTLQRQRNAQHRGRDVIGAQGSARDTLRHLALGPTLGHTQHLSHTKAATLDPSEMLSRWRDPLAKAAVRIIISTPQGSASEVPDLIERYLSPLKAYTRNTWRAAPPVIVPPRDATQSNTNLDNLKDGRRLIGLGWNLRGAILTAGLTPSEGDATLLVLSTLLSHRGGRTYDELVLNHGLIRHYEVDFERDSSGLLTVLSEVRGQNTTNARSQLLEVFESLSRQPPSPKQLRGAASLVATRLRQAWSHGDGQARLIGDLLRSKDTTPSHTPAQWMKTILQELNRLKPRHLQRMIATIVEHQPRVNVTFTPHPRLRATTVPIDADIISAYARLMVDVECPPGGQHLDLRELLETKYQWTPSKYLAISRSLAREPEVLRELTRELHERCAEFTKLRSVLSLKRITKLHKSVACGTGKIANPDARDRALARIFNRFDIDPSLYRPLMAMAREDPFTKRRLQAIDARCSPQHGPGSRF